MVVSSTMHSLLFVFGSEQVKAKQFVNVAQSYIIKRTARQAVLCEKTVFMLYCTFAGFTTQMHKRGFEVHCYI